MIIAPRATIVMAVSVMAVIVTAIAAVSVRDRAAAQSGQTMSGQEAFGQTVSGQAECNGLLDAFKPLVTGAQSKVSASVNAMQDGAKTGANGDDDHSRLALLGGFCAASGEALGTFRAYRELTSECLDKTDAARRDLLSDLDRSIAQIEANVIKTCR